MTKRFATSTQRLQRDVAAQQLTLNPPLRGILAAMRHMTANPRQATADLAKINKVLFSLDFFDPVSGPKRELMFNPRKRAWFLAAPLAWRCLETIVEAANAGKLDSFRECPICKRWFFARTSEHACCSSRCRQKLYASTPEGKEERRKYMRDYRAGKRERERRQDELSRDYWKRMEGGKVNAKRSNRPN